MSAFIRMLWSGRDRRKHEPNPRVQENLARCALYTLHPARNVMAAPQRPPVKDERRA